MSTFNLIDEPWIHVSYKDGRSGEVSLLEAFRSSTEISGIHGEIATQDFAIYRLLIAISHRALDGPEDLDTWLESWNSSVAFFDRIDAYFTQYHDRFDVRSSTKPFFQVAGIRSSSDATSDLSKIISDVPNTEPYFFTMREKEGIEKISWAEASRWLVHTHAFDPSGIRTGAIGDSNVKGGKGYPIGTGWTGQIGGILLMGNNLHETLLLNTVVTHMTNDLYDVDPDEDFAPWERSPDTPEGAVERTPTGPVDCMTWQTRRILLHGNDDGVTSVFLGNGDKAIPQNRFLYESMSAWRYSDPQTKKFKTTVFMPRQHEASTAFWEGLPSLIPQFNARTRPDKSGETLTRFRSPATIQFHQELIARGVLEYRHILPIRAIGAEYGAQNAVIVEVINDSLTLPYDLVSPENSYLVSEIKHAMDLTDRVSYILKSYARNLGNAMGLSPDLNEARQLSTVAAFYFGINTRFPGWLSSLTNESKHAVRDWYRQIEALARMHAEDLSKAMPKTAFSGRADTTGKRMDVGKAHLFFISALKKIEPKEFAGSKNEVSK